MQPSLEHSIWFNEQRFAFVYLPKVACTSWKLFLWQVSGQPLPPDLEYRQVHEVGRLPLPYVGGMEPAQQQQFLGALHSGDLLTIAVVRDPQSRVLSAYLHKILFHDNPVSQFSRSVLPAIQRFHGLKPTQRPSFEQFLQWNGSQPDSRVWNPHWRPMVHLLGPCQRLRLWPMERMEDAIQTVNERFGTNCPFPNRQALGPRVTYNSQDQLTRYVGAKEQTLLQELYRDDLTLHAELVA